MSITAREQYWRYVKLVKIVSNGNSTADEVRAAKRELQEIAEGEHAKDCSCLISWNYDCDCGHLAAIFELRK